MIREKIDIDTHIGHLRQQRDAAIEANIGNADRLLTINASSAMTMTALQTLYQELNAHPDSNRIAHDTIVALAKGAGSALANTLMAISPEERDEALEEIKSFFEDGADFAMEELRKAEAKLASGELQFEEDGTYTVAVTRGG